MIALLQTQWLATLMGVALYALTTWWFLSPHRLVQQCSLLHRRAAAGMIQKLEPSWAFKNPELEQLLAEARQEREALRTRAQELQEWEVRLNTERQEINTVTQAVYRCQTEVDQLVLLVKDEEATNLRRLARVYATMTPEGAAKILREMDDEKVVRILALMKEAETAPILETLGMGDKSAPKRAAMISDRLRLVVRRLPADKAKSP